VLCKIRLPHLNFWPFPPDDQQVLIIELALAKPDLSPRELAVTYTDEQSSFVSESTIYRLLNAHDLITSPTYILIEAADKFQYSTTHVNEMWQTDFTYCKVVGWGWYYLSSVLDDFSRFSIAW
jgi:transposase InsO family protein